VHGAALSTIRQSGFLFLCRAFQFEPSKENERVAFCLVFFLSFFFFSFLFIFWVSSGILFSFFFFSFL